MPGMRMPFFRTTAHAAGRLEHVFVAHPLGQREGVVGVGIDHHLREAFAVAQIDEDHAAVVTATVDPTAQGHGLVDMGGVDLTAVMAAHGGVPGVG